MAKIPFVKNKRRWERRRIVDGEGLWIINVELVNSVVTIRG